MPRGIYARKPKNDAADRFSSVRIVYNNETDEEIDARISERFEILDVLTEATTVGNSRALIVSGPAGLGKSYTVEKRLADWDPNEINHTIVKGYVRATGLVKLLYQYRNAGQVIVFDDADAIFFDDVSLNLLKAVCDTTERRRVSWLSEGKLFDDDTATLISPSRAKCDGNVVRLRWPFEMSPIRKPRSANRRRVASTSS